MHRLFRPSQLLSAQLLALRGTDRLLVWISRGFLVLLLCALLFFVAAGAHSSWLQFTGSSAPSGLALWILPDFADAWLRSAVPEISNEYLFFHPVEAGHFITCSSPLFFFLLATASRQLARKVNTASNSAAIRLDANASRDKAISEAASMKQLIRPPKATPAAALTKSRRGL